MNPYQPPQCSESAAEVAGPAVMQVRYGLGYSLLFVATGLIFVGQAFLMYQLRGRVMGLSVMGLSVAAGVLHLSLAVFTWRRIYFEVFENRIEFLSPVFPRWRRAKPLEFIGARSLHRWVARREDFQRFVEWRDEARG